MVSGMYLGLYWLLWLLIHEGVCIHWGFCDGNLQSILISIWLVSFLVHSNGTSKLPPGCILMERAKTSGMPDVVSGSFITVDLLDLIIFLVPSQVQMMLIKFMEVKSVPSIIGRCMCLQTIKDCVNG